MSEILLFCPDPAGLTLGPGSAPGELIHFHDGFARFDSKDFPEWKSWVNHPTTPRIEVLPPDSAQVVSGTAGSFDCSICDRAFASKFALTGHLRSHAPKG